MVNVSNRPEPTAPLDVLSEASRAEWRDYLLECGLADNPPPVVRDGKSEPVRPPR